MCGRFVLKSDGAALAQLFDLTAALSVQPRFNIAPTQPVTAIRLDKQGLREATQLRWGLIPHWAKEPSIGNRMINARAETVASKPAFRDAFRRRRCLVAADGYYEWAKTPIGKQPYYICRNDEQPFAIAGLWERWHTRDGDTLETTTLLTTEANTDLRELHDRMPVVLEPRLYQAWLDRDANDAQALLDLLASARPDSLCARPVSRLVNNPRNEDPRCIDAVQLPNPG